MIEQAMSQRRTGGREARHALRQAPTPADRAPIRPGLPGGQLRVLSEHDVERVHQTSLDILERIGVGDPKDSWRELVLEHGGRMSETGRLCFVLFHSYAADAPPELRPKLGEQRAVFVGTDPPQALPANAAQCFVHQIPRPRRTNQQSPRR